MLGTWRKVVQLICLFTLSIGFPVGFLSLAADSGVAIFDELMGGFHSKIESQEEITENNEDDVSSSRIPTEIEGASIARTLVFRESLANINTVKSSGKDKSIADIPVSFSEYYVDCDNDGDVYFLLVDMSSTSRNIAHGSEYSITIRVGDHHINDNVNTKYPGSLENSPAGSPRVNIRGKLSDVEDKDGKYDELEKCFLERHPDAKWWIPGKSMSHDSHWAKFIADDIYMIGGFGDRAYIGPVDSGIYHSVTSLDDH